jgi:hypothetical protein
LWVARLGLGQDFADVVHRPFGPAGRAPPPCALLRWQR